MPWTPADVPKHKANLSQESRERWSRIANALLANNFSEGSAIRIANSRVKPSIQRAIQRRLNG